MSPSQHTDNDRSLALTFEERDFRGFYVEHSVQGTDLVYHFFPEEGQSEFGPGFGLMLERAFKKVLNSEGDVRASYSEATESKILGIIRQRDLDKEDPAHLPTYFVKVVGGADRMGFETFLVDRLFGILSTEISDDSRQVLHPEEGPRAVPPGNRGRNRHRGRVRQ